MQKIPTLFIRSESNPKLVSRTVDPYCQWVLDGEGVATEKFDGTACAVIGGRLYKRHKHDAQKGPPPEGWRHWSGEGDSGHGWLPCVRGDSASRYHLDAWEFHGERLPDGTYELVGPKSNGNPHGLDRHELWRHGFPFDSSPPRDFDGLAAWLAEYRPVEGIVWHHPDGRMAKIKRRDFGLPWPVKR